MISCSEYQRYNFLKAIHNSSTPVMGMEMVVQNIKDTIFWKQFTTSFIGYVYVLPLFRISKIQFFESNSQLNVWGLSVYECCSEYQRYNFLKAIHNRSLYLSQTAVVVQNIKDTIFWKQFTTVIGCWCNIFRLFRISKIQFFESNSQLCSILYGRKSVVQNIKDTIFWKQFTTNFVNIWRC